MPALIVSARALDLITDFGNAEYAVGEVDVNDSEKLQTAVRASTAAEHALCAYIEELERMAGVAS